MRVFISADIEGTAGITTWPEATKGDPLYAEFRALMTGEVRAAIEGARAAGATEITVKDAHETGCNLILAELPEDVRIIRGWSGHPHSMMFGIEAGFDAALFTGYHNAAGTDTNPLAHTLNGRISRMLVNGELASEFTLNAHTAAACGAAPAFLSGDKGICDAARALVPGIATVAVSEGFGPATASLTPAGARAAIREGVAAALSRDLSACRLPLPETFELVIEFENPRDAYRGSWYPGAEHPGARTLRFRADNWFDIMRAIRFIS